MRYLSVGGGELRIQTQDGQLVFKDDLNKLQVTPIKTELAVGDYVVQNRIKKFAIGQLAVIDANPEFKSEVTPFKQGISPLFDMMSEAGATVTLIGGDELRKYYRKGLKLFLAIGGAMIALPLIILLVILLVMQKL